MWWKRCSHMAMIPIVFGGETERQAFVMHASVELYKPLKATDRGQVRLALCGECGALRLSVDYPATENTPEMHEDHYYGRSELRRLAEREPGFVLSNDGSRLIRKSAP